MKLYIILSSLIILIGFNIKSFAAVPATTTPFTPSDFQKNGAAITTLESNLQSYVTQKETEDLDFNLHLVDFSGNQIQSPQEQFFNDFTRMSCNKKYAGNLNECGNSLVELSPYAHLRSSNIFDVLTYANPAQNLIASTVARTLIEPFPDDQLNQILSDPKEANNSNNQTSIANLIASQAGVMLAQNSINKIIATRYSSDGEKSIMKLIHDESFRRVSDPTWTTNMTQLAIDGLLMELLQVEAFKLWVDYYKFTQNERIEALLATLLSRQITSNNKMSGQIEKSKKDNSKAAEDAKAASADLPTFSQ